MKLSLQTLTNKKEEQDGDIGEYIYSAEFRYHYTLKFNSNS